MKGNLNPKEIIDNVSVLNIHRSFGVDSNPEISDIIYDSRKVVSNCIFVCLSGSRIDAHEYVNEAISRGAVAGVSRTRSRYGWSYN